MESKLIHGALLASAWTLASLCQGCLQDASPSDPAGEDASEWTEDSSGIIDSGALFDSSARDSVTDTRPIATDTRNDAPAEETIATPPDCNSPGGLKCKTGTVCVPAMTTSGALLGGYACQPTDGAIGHGCTGCASGKQQCAVGAECWRSTKTGVEFCSPGCNSNGDCGATGCCKKSPDAACMNTSCLGGAACSKLGFCAPC